MANDLSIEVTTMKKWLAQVFVYSFWSALIITVVFGLAKIFGVQFSATRWWDVLFIPLIFVATIKTICPYHKFVLPTKIVLSAISFSCSIVAVGFVATETIRLEHTSLNINEVIVFSAVPVFSP